MPSMCECLHVFVDIVQLSQPLVIEGMVDRVYVDADADKGDVFLCPGDKSHVKIINRSGFRDIAAWHPPGRTLHVTTRDNVATQYTRCSQHTTTRWIATSLSPCPPRASPSRSSAHLVNNAACPVHTSHRLYPGELWTGEMTLRAFDYYWQTPIFERGGGAFVPPKVSREAV